MGKEDKKQSTAQEPAPEYGSAAFIQKLRRGVPARSIEGLRRQMGITRGQMAALLHISDRTMQRLRDDTVLDASASQIVVLLEYVCRQGVLLFGSEERFAQWLKVKVPNLNHETPLSLLDTFTGIEEVRQTLGRIEWGMY